ncbi:MAG: substrate-binding domain-containing protein [Clostridium sp.]|nr:substrate-binding domain-containing protein [Clostridium sp.]MCM1548333.1 substrate-binding domain-containing protein [Ruminococcus sp.]
MKTKFNKKYIPSYTALFIILICIAAVIFYFGKLAVIYLTGSEITEDKTANINVMLTRPDNWEMIQTGKISLTEEDLAMIDGSTATVPITAELARQFCGASDDNISDLIDHNTTHFAYRNLIYTRKKPSGYTDEIPPKYLIFATEPSEEELSMASELRVGLDITPVAMDGFVFITHKDNPVDSLTVEQVKKIYTGEITNWSEVGGEDAEIIPYQRESNSGSQTAMEQFVMEGELLTDPADGYRINGMGELIEKIGEYKNRKNSIGYTYYYYINNLYKSDDIKTLKINGISPENENLLNGSYPFTTSYYAVMTDDTTGIMRELRDYLLTSEGQEIIRLAGYCPVK